MTYTYTLPISNPPAVHYDSVAEALIDAALSGIGTERSLLFIPCRKAPVKYCRWFVWEVLYAIKGYNLGQCARVFGSYDHTTVMHAMRELPEALRSNVILRHNYARFLERIGVTPEEIKRGLYERKYPIKPQKLTVDSGEDRPLTLARYKAKLKKLQKLSA